MAINERVVNRGADNGTLFADPQNVYRNRRLTVDICARLMIFALTEAQLSSNTVRTHGSANRLRQLAMLFALTM